MRVPRARREAGLRRVPLHPAGRETGGATQLSRSRRLSPRVAKVDWDSLSRLLASKHRLAVLVALRSPKTPSHLALALEVPLPRVSRALRDLERIRAVRCLNPRRRKGKLYARTARGNGLLRELRRLTR